MNQMCFFLNDTRFRWNKNEAKAIYLIYVNKKPISDNQSSNSMWFIRAVAKQLEMLACKTKKNEANYKRNSLQLICAVVYLFWNAPLL